MESLSCGTSNRGSRGEGANLSIAQRRLASTVKISDDSYGNYGLKQN